MKKVFIIAEAGDNHNGDINLALKLIDKAVEAKADCVKFQTFITGEIISQHAKKADYQIEATGEAETQYEMVKKLELSFQDFTMIKQYCDQKGILFLSTPFDIPSVEFLESLGMPFWKIPSGEITNLPYLIRIAQTHKDIILSTGMCEIDEIRQAVHILKKYGGGRITLLHCNTQYPTPYSDVNLSAMNHLRQVFQMDVGYSDHTLGIEIPIAAAAQGACVIEKHFTLDKNMKGPDHQASLEPDELAAMVKAVRNIELALGDGIKKPSISERPNIEIARKSIVARCSIQKGELFTENNLAVKRPGNGISPMKWFDMLGTYAEHNYEKDELI